MEKEDKIALAQSVYEILVANRVKSNEFISANSISIVLFLREGINKSTSDIESTLVYLQSKGLVVNDGFLNPTMWQSRTPTEIVEWKAKRKAKRYINHG